MNIFNNFTDKERETFSKFLSIMENGSKAEMPNPDDVAFITNNAQPMVDSLMKAIAKWSSDYGIDETEMGSMLILLNKISHLAGGINFADFAITESMAKKSGE